MKLKLFLLLFMMFFLCGLNIANAVVPPDGDEYKYKISVRQGCNGSMSSGLSCGNGDECAEKSFCDVQQGLVCSLCSNLDHEGYDYSERGAYGYRSCFKFCPRQRLYYDNKASGWLEPDTQNACYGHECTYDQHHVVCDNETDECNGYHAEGDTCVPNKQECTGDHGKGFKFWECNEDGTSCAWSDCLLTQCDDTYHLEPTEIDSNNNKEYGFICNSNTIYGKCVKDTAECASMLGDCKNSKGEGGEINGTAYWTTDGTEIKDAPGKWNFAGCSCETSNESIDGGIGGKECWYTSSGAWGKSPVVWNTRCEITEAVSCNLGYCQPDGAEGCVKAPEGYYHDNTADFTCQPCPIGATSAVGAAGIDRCFMQTGNTEFCDSVGCFKLPSNVPY